MTDTVIYHKKLYEEDHFVHILPKITLKSLKKSYFLQYSPLSIEFTNKLCKIAGFEYFHSINHMAIVEDNVDKFLLVNEIPLSPSQL